MKHAEYPLAPLGDSAAMDESESLQIVDDSLLSDAAEEMLETLSPDLRAIALKISTFAADARERAQTAVELAVSTGALLIQLQDGMGYSHGGDRRSQNFNPPRGGLKIIFSFSDLASELGVPRRTAERWMSLAKTEQLARRIEAGEEVELPAKNEDEEPQIVGGTIEQREIAREWRESLYAGETPINRAQPALMGALATKKTGRAPCDHARNIAKAVRALANSLEHWTKLTPAERAECEALWSELARSGLIPGTWEGWK